MKMIDLERTLSEQLEEILTPEMKNYIKYVNDNNLKLLVHNSPKNTTLFLKTRAKGGVDYKTDKMHMPPDIKDFIDNYLQEKFGHPYRTVSLYTTQIGSSSYGNAYAVIPFGGKVSYCYSDKVKDLLFNYMDFLKEVEERIYAEIKKTYPQLSKAYEQVEGIILNPHHTFAEKITYVKEKLGDNSDSTNIGNIINNAAMSMLSSIAESYNVTDSLSTAISSIPSDYEIMIDAPKFLLINKKYVSSKFSKSVEDYLKRFL